MWVSQRFLAGFISISLLATVGKCDEAIALVGQFGNPAQWQISGVESFDPEDVKRALSRDFDIVLAAHPQAPRSELAKAMSERLLEGFRKVGFAGTEATVQLDEQSGQVNIRVAEGQRYHRGGIRIIGVDDEVAEQLRRSLTTKQLPAKAITPVFDDDGEPLRWLDQDGNEMKLEKALWVEGKPAAFNQSVRNSIDHRITRTLAELGYVGAKVQHELVLGNATATLIVRVDDIGTQAVLREIEIVGHDRNSRKEIIDYLQLRVGERFASAEKHRTLLALRASARFVEQHVETKEIDPNGGIQLSIKLKELSVAPRLSEPLSREDVALLKLYQWETHGEGRHLDRILHAETESGTFDGVLAPNSGLVVRWQTRGSDPVNAKPVALALVASTQETTFFNLRDRRCLSLPVETFKVELSTAIKVQGEDIEHPFTFTFGFGFSPAEKDEPRRPIKMKTTIEPVYYLAFARLQHPVYSWNGDNLTIRTDRGTLTVDSQTGRLVNRSFTTDSHVSCTFEYRAGALDQATSQLKQYAVGVRNEYDPEHPISSTVRFGCCLLEVLAALKPDGEMLQRFAEPNAVAAIEKLLAQGLLHECDDAFVLSSQPENSDDFSIPPSEAFAFSVVGIARIAASMTDVVFRRDTWPAVVWRESALYFAGHREYIGPEVVTIVQDDSIGPIGHWILAELLQSINSRLSQSIAQLGLMRFSHAAFERDVALLAGNWTGHLYQPVRALCSLSDEEVAAIGRIMLNDPDPLVRTIQRFRQSGDQNANAYVQFTLGHMWSNERKQQITWRLQALSQDRLPSVAKESAKTIK